MVLTTWSSTEEVVKKKKEIITDNCSARGYYL